jgi:hypothetical protein
MFLIVQYVSTLPTTLIEKVDLAAKIFENLLIEKWYHPKLYSQAVMRTVSYSKDRFLLKARATVCG